VREQLPELLRHDDVAALLERLGALAPKLAAALDKALNHSQLLKVLRAAGRGRVAEDIVPIATTCWTTPRPPRTRLLAAEVRCTLRRQIVNGLCGPAAELKAFNLGGELENCCWGAEPGAPGNQKVALDNFPIDPQLLSQLHCAPWRER
jgi:flagellar biosynthesis protein FlhA